MARKQIVFDLDTNELKAYYPKEHWRNAYYEIRNFFLKNNFTWVQGSTYYSNQSILDAQVKDLLVELIEKYPYLNKCVRDCRITTIGKSFSQNDLFDKNASIPTRIGKESCNNSLESKISNAKEKSAKQATKSLTFPNKEHREK